MQGLSLGKLVLPPPGSAKVEILGRILGAGVQEVRSTALLVQMPRVPPFEIIHPVLLYMVKGNNAVQLDQREAGRERQDSRQFAIMSLVIHQLLRQLVEVVELQNARSLVKTRGRLLDFWLSEDGAALVAAGVVQPAKLLPTAAMRRHPEESVRHLVEKRWPVFHERQLPSAVARVSQRTVEKLRADFEALLAPLHDALAAD